MRVLTTHKSDVPGTVWAGKHVMTLFLRAGVRIYECTPQSLHAKVITVDGVYGVVGSFNLDYLSSYRNLEVVLSALDRPFVQQLDADFFSDFRAAREVELQELERRNVLERLGHFLAYQVARLFRNFNFGESKSDRNVPEIDDDDLPPHSADAQSPTHTTKDQK